VAPATLLINCNSPGEGWGDCLMKEWGKSDQYRLKYSQFRAKFLSYIEWFHCRKTLLTG
jgi:hypothetical protein